MPSKRQYLTDEGRIVLYSLLAGAGLFVVFACYAVVVP